MDLNDVVYVIDGSLGLRELPCAPGSRQTSFEAVLYDNTRAPCHVEEWSGSPPVVIEARAQAVTRVDALDALVKLLAGNILLHDQPLMWTTSTDKLRVPPTLVVGLNPVINASEKTAAGVAPTPAP